MIPNRRLLNIGCLPCVLIGMGNEIEWSSANESSDYLFFLQWQESLWNWTRVDIRVPGSRAYFNFHLALFENRKRKYLSKVIELIYGRRLDNLSCAHVVDEYKIQAFSSFQRSHQNPLYLWKILVSAVVSCHYWQP